MLNSVLRNFISGKWENSINEDSMYYSYVFPTDDVIEYIRSVNNILISEIIDAVTQHDGFMIYPRDVFQFSSLDNCTYRLCDILNKCNNPGISYLEAGMKLLNDGSERTKGAYTKYGENHLKTSELLGLTFSIANTYFLSSIGMVYCELDEVDRKKILTRTVLRSRLISRMMKAGMKGKVNMRQFLSMLSDSTYNRRRSNIKSILKILEDSEEYNFFEITERFIF